MSQHQHCWGHLVAGFASSDRVEATFRCCFCGLTSTQTCRAAGLPNHGKFADKDFLRREWNREMVKGA